MFLFLRRYRLPGTMVLWLSLIGVVLLAAACGGATEPGERAETPEPTTVATEAADDTGEATGAPDNGDAPASETEQPPADDPEPVVQRQILFFHTEW